MYIKSSETKPITSENKNSGTLTFIHLILQFKLTKLRYFKFP